MESQNEYIDRQIAGIERLIAEYDRRYEERHLAAKEAVAAAFDAAKEAVASALTSQKEAVVKAEEAQKAYNSAHNDLARKMDDQYNYMLPRQEADSRFSSMADKIDDLKAQIGNLRESRSVQHGERDMTRWNKSQSNFWVGVAMTALLGLLGMAIGIIFN